MGDDIPSTSRAPLRSKAELWEQYEIERELADRLRAATKAARTTMYGEVYDELFRRVPSHPQLARKRNPHNQESFVAERISLLRKLVRPGTIFLEIGAGDCRLALEVATRVKHVYALEVSREVTRGVIGPANFEVVYGNGTQVAVASDTVTLAYSYQVIEHMHSEDVVEQLREILRVLAPDGVYLCITPNRLAGPHDVSKYFTQEARGIHLKEYALEELATIFHAAGFSTVAIYPGLRGHFARLPIGPVVVIERILNRFPYRLRRAIANVPLIRNLIFAAVIARKARS